jgi:hypothetical protein
MVHIADSYSWKAILKKNVTPEIDEQAYECIPAPREKIDAIVQQTIDTFVKF